VDLRQIRYFVSVARSGSFVRASRELHISQPALGYQIRQLETELGVELLLRHSRGVILTEPGQVLLAHAEDILERMDRAEKAMDAFRNTLAGDITLGVTPTCGRVLAPELLERCAVHPNLRIGLREGLSNELFQATSVVELDMSFCYDPPASSPANVAALYREQLFLIGPPDMLQEFGGSIPFRELGRFPLILDNRFQVLRQLIESTAQPLGMTLNVTLEIEPVNLKREMIVHHRRCTVLPYGLFRDEIEDGQLTALAIEDPVLERTMHFAVRPGLLPSIERFMLSTVRTLVRQKISGGEVGWREP